MKFLKSFRGAVAVLAAVVLLTIPAGAHRSLLRERAKVEPAAAVLQTQLDRYYSVAANLNTVAARYLSQEARAPLTAALEGERDYGGVAQGSAAVLAALDRQPLTAEDAAYVQGFRVDLGAQSDIISRAEYHDQAAHFNGDILGRFPASALGPLTGIRPWPVYR